MQNFSLRNFGLAFLVILVLSLTWVPQAWAQEGDEEDQLQQGALLYADNCAVCHGSTGEGRVGATLAKDWPSIRPDLLVKTTIENGVAGSPMPAWSQENNGPLGEEEIDALVAYILNWETGGPRIIPPSPIVTSSPPITPVPNIVGDPNQGYILYGQNCAVCHGSNGEGRIGVTLAKAWPSIRADLGIKTSIANGVAGSPMPAWSQANGGPLSETDIDDLVAFITSLPAVSTQTNPTPASLAPTSDSWITGWVGVILLVALFALIVGIAILVQSRRPQ